MKLLLRLAAILLLLLHLPCYAHDASMPNFERSVIRLNAQNFDGKFYDKKTAWMLLLTKSNFHYAHRVEHIFLQMTNMVEPWKSVASTGVLDCEDLTNIGLCRKFHVKRFPQILFLPADVAASNLSYPYSPERFGDLVEQTPQRLKTQLIDFLCADISKPTAIWPPLFPFPELDQQNVWYKVPPNVRSVAIIFDSPMDYFGREVILNSLRLRNCITVCRGDAKTAKFAKIKYFKEPFMIFSNRDQGGLFLKAITNDTVDSFHDYLAKYVENCISKEPNNATRVPFGSLYAEKMTPEPQPGSINVVNQGFSQNRTGNRNPIEVNHNVLYAQDMESALNYLLISEVGMLSVIVEDELKALKDFMYVLQLYLPLSEQIKSLLGNLRSWLNEHSTNIPSQLYDLKIRDLKTRYEHKFDAISWVGCKGSRRYFRGYPCGLWLTFHALTVNYYKMNGNQPHFDPLLVLSAIRDYVRHLFGCVECVNHFLFLSSNMREEVKSKEESVLWLWRVHNAVNRKVVIDNDEDPYHPNVQFPSEEQCELCQTFVEKDGNVQWDEQQVLNFLLAFYSQKPLWESDFQKIY